MSFFNELKRRNVIKVGAACLALAWVVVQATGAIVPAHNLPVTLVSTAVWIGIIAIAAAYAYRSESDRAFEWLDKALAYRGGGGTIHMDPYFAALHDDPRRMPFLRAHGMGQDQLAAIPFEVEQSQPGTGG